MPKQKQTKIVIAGGGFGGVKAALELADDSRFDVTLISDNSDLQYYPTLFRTATGGRRMISSIPLSEIFIDRAIKIINAKVTGLDRQAKKIITDDKQAFSYDKLIMGLGVETNFFGIKGLKEFSFGIKTTTQAEEFKDHLHEQICGEHKLDLNYVIIGGGPTGVELAGALPSYIRKIMSCHNIKHKAVKVSLVEAAPRLLSRSPKDVSRSVARHLRKLGVRVHLNSRVQAETVDGLMVNGRLIESRTVVWTAGVTNNPFFSEHSFQMNRHGKVRVDQFLQAEPDIYVIGDNADTPYSGLAQTALYDGRYVARNLIRCSDGEEEVPYLAKKPIYVFPAGEFWAAVVWGRIRLYGRLGWMLRRAADLMGYRDYESLFSASKRWLAESDYEDSCPACHL